MEDAFVGAAMGTDGSSVVAGKVRVGTASTLVVDWT